MANRLADQVSPYLLQHKDNPVDWWPWGPDALAEARSSSRPILLSVGYAACHWCHVMAHESFEDPATAALMNELFVNIKVDREERPDIDQIYMSALHALGQQGGWPLTMFLTPQAEPIWGGTYFPPASRYGRPGFPEVLQEIARVVAEEPERVAGSSTAILEHLRAEPQRQAVDVDPSLLDTAAAQLLGLMDRERGGTSGAPKFPQASLFECLWRAGRRTGNPDYTDAVATTLTAICQGGIFDHIGGGFARYSVDAMWLVPHFEKMLYDNAQLIELLTFAYPATQSRLFAQRIEETIAWLARDMSEPGGGLAASLDADSDGKEGTYYVWTPDQVNEVLAPDDAALFSRAYDITPDGNWEGVSIPNRLRTPATLSEAEESTLAAARATLLDHRTGHIPPAKDDKILADWNGLAIAAIATAALVFDRPDWLEIAKTAYRFVTESLMRDGRFAHAYRAGNSVFPGLATDFAFMIKAALALAAATSEAAYLRDARAWTNTFNKFHKDPDGPGYFLTAHDAEDLISRPRADHDDAIPAATSIMAQNLVRLWHVTGEDTYRDQADAIITGSGAAITANVFANTSLLNAFDLRLAGISIILIAPPGSDTGPPLAAIRAAWNPNAILATYGDGAAIPAGHPASGKAARSGRATVYVCREGSCSLPATEPAEITALVEA